MVFMKKINYIELGATLFIPANHKNLQDVAFGIKYQALKSLLIDLEDSVSEIDLEEGIKKLKDTLYSLEKKKLFIFVRPRDSKNLKQLLQLENIQKIDGFILPKFSLANSSEYLSLLEKTDFSFMPSIEGSELFDMSKLIKLKDNLVPYKDKVILVRFGLEDMLRQLKMKRKADESIFDFSVTSSILGQFLSIFKSAGFGVSGGVYPYFQDEKGFIKDALRDLKEGLFTKTIIHPNQIEPLNKIYKVKEQELDDALEIVFNDKAIFNQDGKMAEKTTMTPYSQDIVTKSFVYGITILT